MVHLWFGLSRHLQSSALWPQRIRGGPADPVWMGWVTLAGLCKPVDQVGGGVWTPRLRRLSPLNWGLSAWILAHFAKCSRLLSFAQGWTSPWGGSGMAFALGGILG